MDDLRNEILIRHLAGIASSRSVASLQRWIEEDPAFAEHVTRVRAAWEAAGVIGERHDPELGLARLLARIVGDARAASPEEPSGRDVWTSSSGARIDRDGRAAASAGTRSVRDGRAASSGTRSVRDGRAAPSDRRDAGRPPVWWARRRPAAGEAGTGSTRNDRPWMPWAAAALLVAGVAAFWGARVLRAPELVSRATTVGQRATLRLGDGSEVLLGPETELRFPARFRGRSREVVLRGSAYFDVSRDERRPFIVRAAGTVTQVLGTRFIVRAYEGDADVEIAVAEGRVAVRRDSAPEMEAAVVTEGQLARVPETGAAEVVRDADIDALFGWTEGRVVFNDRPLAQVVRELERWYGRRIRIAEPAVGARRVTLSFEDASLDEILDVVVVSLELRVEQEPDGGVAIYDATATPGR